MSLRNILYSLAYFCFVIALAFVIIELIYRQQWIDFYRTELKLLNEENTIKKDTIDLLVIGDSFSANEDGYVKKVQKHFPEKAILNASVRGTGLAQQLFIFKKRKKQYHIKQVLIQSYEGNDLMDVLYPYHNASFSFTRNLYWKIAQHFRWVSFFNYRMSGIKAKGQTPPQGEVKKKAYNRRTKLYLDADPLYLQKINNLEGYYDQAFSHWTYYLDLLAEKAKLDQVYFMHIPHCNQVDSVYVETYKELAPKINYDLLGCPSALENKMSSSISSRLPKVKLLPLCEVFRAASESIYYDHDPHLNEKGHEILAKHLITQLTLNGFEN